MFYQVVVIHNFDPEPDPHFRFLCEHGACIFIRIRVVCHNEKNTEQKVVCFL